MRRRSGRFSVRTRLQAWQILARTWRRWKTKCGRPHGVEQKSTSDVPKDQLSLWMLTEPDHPVLVGGMSLALNGQGVGPNFGDGARKSLIR